MSKAIDPTEATPRFLSLAALKEAHGDLLQRRRAEGESPALLDSIAAFISRAQATGALLDDDGARDTTQSLLTYWDNLLYRAGRIPPESTLAEFDPLLAPELPDELCPYVGLDAFTENDGEKFFGRRELINRLIERLNTHRLIAVVGPSGSGKSSVARAGVIPGLRNGALAGSEGWVYCPPIVPGSNPLASLDRVFKTENQDSRTEKQELGTVDKELVLGSPVPSSTVVLIVDQFEELFTLCDDEAARQEFANQLLALAEAPGTQHRVVLTMRSDFETFIARLPQLQPLFEAGHVQVTPLSAAELREAIERPAEAVGLKFEVGVVDLLLQDILGEPAGLPLLQFSLLKLWEQRERNRITRSAYERVGGGRLALARNADNFYTKLIPEEQITARRILLRLVRPGAGLEITSSRIRRTDLYHGGEDPGRVYRVVEKLVQTRLLRVTEGDVPGDTQVELAHEALVRNWPTLVDWLEQEKAALAVRRRLDGRAAEWVRLGRGAGGLLDQIELQEAERWLAGAEVSYLGYDPALPDLVEASQWAIERRACRAAIARFAVVAVSLVVAVLGIGLAIYAFQQRRDALQNERTAQQNAYEAATAQAQAQQEAALARTAEAQTKQQNEVVESQQLAFAANSQVQAAPEIALLLAIEAAKRKVNRITEQALRDALNRTTWQPTALNGHTSTIYSAVFSPDGQRILTASSDNTARLWDVNGTPLATLEGHTAVVNSAVFSPGGQRILTASSDGTARQYLAKVGDLLKVAAGRVGGGLTEDEIKRFQVPTPLRFDFAKRQCPPALGR